LITNTNDKSDKIKLEQVIEENLKNDLPVILSFGVSFIILPVNYIPPPLLTNSIPKLPEYRVNHKNAPLKYEIIEGFETNKEIQGPHMMNIIGIRFDKITQQTTLIIASWGMKIEIDLDEYCGNPLPGSGYAYFVKN
jgi:hypothetical protein